QAPVGLGRTAPLDPSLAGPWCLTAMAAAMAIGTVLLTPGDAMPGRSPLSHLPSPRRLRAYGRLYGPSWRCPAERGHFPSGGTPVASWTILGHRGCRGRRDRRQAEAAEADPFPAGIRMAREAPGRRSVHRGWMLRDGGSFTPLISQAS